MLGAYTYQIPKYHCHNWRYQVNVVTSATLYDTYMLLPSAKVKKSKKLVYQEQLVYKVYSKEKLHVSLPQNYKVCRPLMLSSYIDT